MERCTIVVHRLQVFSFIRKDICAKLTGTAVAMPGGGGIIPKITAMSGGSIPAIKVNLRTIRRVNPNVQKNHLEFTVKLVCSVRDAYLNVETVRCHVSTYFGLVFVSSMSSRFIIFPGLEVFYIDLSCSSVLESCTFYGRTF